MFQIITSPRIMNAATRQSPVHHTSVIEAPSVYVQILLPAGGLAENPQTTTVRESL